MALPYGVKVWYKYYSENVTEKFATSIRLVDGKIALSSKFNREGDWYPIEEANELLIKPYLRPMSSMTLKEIEEFRHFKDYLRESECKIHIANYNQIQWLLETHFDFMGLIPKGLAVDATEENITEG